MPAPCAVTSRHDPVVVGDNSIDIEVAFGGGVTLAGQDRLQALADSLVDGFDTRAVAVVDGFAVSEQEVEEPRGDAALLEAGIGVGGCMRAPWVLVDCSLPVIPAEAGMRVEGA